MMLCERIEVKRMLIVNNDRTSILNMDNVVNIYVGANECSIKYHAKTDGQIATYPNAYITKEAMRMLAEGLESCDVFVMPTTETVEERIKQKNSEGKQEKVMVVLKIIG